MFKKLFLTVLVLGLMVGVGYAGGVTDNNNGNEGDIFVSTGHNSGSSSEGTWTDASFLKGEDGHDGIDGQDGKQGIQGVKGDTGEQGVQGEQGIKGDTGEQGIAGQDGVDGEKGDKGDTGDKGDNGKDVDPSTVTNLQETDIQLQDNINIESTARTNANNTLNNRIDDTNNRVSKLEDTQGIVGAEVRVYDSKKWTVTTFVDYTTTRNTVDRAGVRVTYKMGESYEERRANELEARLNKLEGIQNTKEREDSVQYYTTANGMGMRGTF